MKKTQKKAAPKKQEEKKPEEKKLPKANPLDPLQALTDLVTGAIFEGPKKVAEEVAEAAEDVNDASEEDDGDEEQRSEGSSGTSININLGDLFRKRKPKRSGTAPATEAGTGKAPGKQDEAEE